MSEIPNWVNVMAAWWTALMWVLGAILTTLALILGVQAAAWKAYKEIVGWPTIVKALRAYHDSQRGEP